MVKKCSMYSVRLMGQYLNLPFVALNDEQAITIVTEAYKECDTPMEFDIVKIGSFDVIEGVANCEHEVIYHCSINQEESINEVPSSV